MKKYKGEIVIIKYSKDSIIYVACPAKIYTGGPELLHQLVYKLNNFGYSQVTGKSMPDWKDATNRFLKEMKIISY